MPLPVCLSDVRGFSLAFLGALAADVTITQTQASGKKGIRLRPLTVTLGSICLAGYAFSVAFYVHTTRTVFNRRATCSLSTYWAHLQLTRPLEALWRLLTAPLRATPDFQILGEVRTGTTTFASHLRSIGCQGPFSPWIVPLAVNKESFYFAGHYFGLVHPTFYKMAFPLKPVLWFRRRILGQPAPVFDACASHLNTPWTAPLMKRVCPEAALVVQVREPSLQHQSWWGLENGAHMWAKGMGMSLEFVPPNYPPKTFQEAMNHSRSPEIAALYKEGEELGQQIAKGAVSSRLHEKYLPFPGGQLVAFAHMGRYADNVKRFIDNFGLGRIIFVETPSLETVEGVEDAARRLGALVPAVLQLQEQASQRSPSTKEPERLNAAPPLPTDLQPTEVELQALREFYKKDNQRFFELIGQDFGWNN